MPAPRCDNSQTGNKEKKELRMRMQRTTQRSAEVHSLEQTWLQADKNFQVVVVRMKNGDLGKGRTRLPTDQPS